MKKNIEEINEIKNLNRYIGVDRLVDVIEDTWKVRNDLMELYIKMQYVGLNIGEQEKLGMMISDIKSDFVGLYRILKMIENRK